MPLCLDENEERRQDRCARDTVSEVVGPLGRRIRRNEEAEGAMIAEIGTIGGQPPRYGCRGWQVRRQRIRESGGNGFTSGEAFGSPHPHPA